MRGHLTKLDLALVAWREVEGEAGEGGDKGNLAGEEAGADGDKGNLAVVEGSAGDVMGYEEGSRLGG
jgi:hypothetical protein